MTNTRPINRDSVRPVGLGSPVSNIGSTLPSPDMMPSEVLLVVNCIDDSGSMGPRADALVKGSNELISALRGAKAAQSVYLAQVFLNGGAFHPFMSLAEVPFLTSDTYNPSGRTPLYDVAFTCLTVVEEQVRRLSLAGINATGHVCLSSDGFDNPNGPGGRTAADVRQLAERMLDTESHMLMALGFGSRPDDGTEEKFYRLFTEMGVPRQQVLVPGDSPSAMRAAYGAVSESILRGPGGEGGSSTATGFMQ